MMHELSLSGFDPAVFLCKIPKAIKDVSYVQSGEWTILAWARARQIFGNSKKVLDQVKKEMIKRSQKLDSSLPFIGGAIGWVSYDVGYELHGIASRHPQKSKLPLIHFNFYDNAVLWNGEKVFVIGDAAFKKSVETIHASPLRLSGIPAIELRPSITRAQYDRGFKKIHGHIIDGDTYQLNYTYKLKAESGIPRRELFLRLLKRNRASCASYVEGEDSALISLSPERFVTIKNGTITTQPIKGTRPRGKTPLEDKKMQHELLVSQKEEAELNMITDLLRNDVGQIALPGTVKVTKHREVHALPSVWHTSSTIEAKIDPAIHPISAFMRMFPGGSITGCPKARSMEIIDDIETERRGPYTGSVVMMSDHGVFDSSIIIRTLVSEGKKLSVGIGGGIVYDSKVAQEFDEALKKAKPFLGLGQGSRRVWVNGREVGLSHPMVKFLDPGNAKVEGMFTTMKAMNGDPIFLNEHYRRIFSSSPGTRRPGCGNVNEFREMIVGCIKNLPWPHSRIKIVWTGKDIIIGIDELIPDPSIQNGVRVAIIPCERTEPGIKQLPYIKEYRVHMKAAQDGCDDALLLARDGTIPEAAYSNLFWVKNGVLYTADERMLPGITRAHILQSAKRLKIQISYMLATRGALADADEVFLTRSIAGVVPVVEIDGEMVGKGVPGRVTRLLMS